MTSQKLIEALETYSNVIVGFVVIQSIGFSFTFGTTPIFTCTVHTTNHLAQGLIVHFVGSTILSCVAIALMKNAIERLATEHVSVLRYVYWAKILVVILFAVIPIVLLWVYSLDYQLTYAECLAARKGL